MVAFWIYSTLSILHFALAAPVAVGEIVEARSNPVQVLNNGMEKRTGPNDEDQSPTKEVDNNPGNNVHLQDGDPVKDSDHPDGAPGVVKEGVGAKGVKEEGISRWGWQWELPWDAEELGSGGRESAVSLNNPPNNPPKKESDDRAVQSSQGSAENMGTGAESAEHSATPDLMTSLIDWFKQPGQAASKIFRPRNSGTGAVGTSRREAENR